jgi:GGDEF domain-containing protein
MPCQEQLQECQKAIEILKKENEKLKRDNLTNVYNRHYLDECLEVEYYPKIYQHKDWFYNIILIDLNDLHNYNRKFGYEEGDKFIKNTVSKIKSEMKKQNVSGRIFRIGGDEFLIVYQPYDVLNLDVIKGITCTKSFFNKEKAFREAIREADKEIIKKKTINKRKQYETSND